MTALIKSTDGSGWVPARVGDVVTVGTAYPNNKYKVINITAIGRLSVRMVSAKDWDMVIESGDCQLIERPFQVGDEANEWMEISMDWRKRNFKVTENDLRLCEVGDLIIRHSSPLLRPVGGI